jgi:hypothetical protein
MASGSSELKIQTIIWMGRKALMVWKTILILLYFNPQFIFIFFRTTHEFLFGALAELVDNSR